MDYQEKIENRAKEIYKSIGACYEGPWEFLIERDRDKYRTFAILEEINKCADDPIYFYENYITVNGQKPILRDRDRYYFDKLKEFRRDSPRKIQFAIMRPYEINLK